jgi:hypothetical protein
MHLQLVEPKLQVKVEQQAKIVLQVLVGLLAELVQVAVMLQLVHS